MGDPKEGVDAVVERLCGKIDTAVERLDGKFDRLDRKIDRLTIALIVGLLGVIGVDVTGLGWG